MARGNHGQSIFKDDKDRHRFIETLAEACEKTGWKVHAFVLMANHYHLLITTPEPNLRRHEMASGHLHPALLARGLKALGLTEKDLEVLAYSAPEKVVLSWWLRKQTTVSLQWAGERLKMGHYTRVTQAVSRMSRKPNKPLRTIARKLPTAAE
jgi:hypothetical protein